MKHIPLRALVTTLALLGPFTVHASLEQIGKRPGKISLVGELSGNTSTVSVLAGVIPADWVLLQDRDSRLQPRLQAEKGEPWIVPLSRLADESPVKLVVDWNRKVVRIDAVAQPVVDLEAAERERQAALAQNLPIPAKAVAASTAQNAFDLLARRHHLNLSYAAAIDPSLGAYTVRGLDLAEDLEALFVALPADVALSVHLYRGSDTLLVRDMAAGEKRVVVHKGAYEGVLKRLPLAAPSPAPVPVAAHTAASPPGGETLVKRASPLPVAPAALPPIVPGSAAVLVPAAELSAAATPANADATGPAAVDAPASPAVSEPAPATPPAPAFVLQAKTGDRMSTVIEAMLDRHGYAMVWRAESDVEARNTFTLEGSSIKNVLEQVLPRLGLTASVYGRSKTVVVTSETQNAPF